MIISHKHKFIFFKPMKCAGSSVELALIPHCGDDDIITGTGYEEELSASEMAYFPKNNFRFISQTMFDEHQITTVEPVYHSHITPSELCQKYENYDDISDYFSFTVMRNPFDALVSYFWWSFYGPPIMGESKVKYDYNFGKVIVPMSHDSETILRIKFQQFLESAALFNKNETIGNFLPGDNVLTWFARFQNSFCKDNIDHVLSFENLQLDFQQLCKRLNININEVPNLKSQQRKVRLAYNAYYSSYTEEIVHRAFKELIEKFSYTF